MTPECPISLIGNWAMQTFISRWKNQLALGRLAGGEAFSVFPSIRLRSLLMQMGNIRAMSRISRSARYRLPFARSIPSYDFNRKIPA